MQNADMKAFEHVMRLHMREIKRAHRKAENKWLKTDTMADQREMLRYEKHMERIEVMAGLK